MWKDIKDFEGLYQISNKGEIKSLSKQKGFLKKGETILKQKINKSGYLAVGLWKDKVRYDRLVHRLVAIAFIENRNNKKQINHKDGNKKNNNVKNIAWVSPSENIKHAYKLGLISMVGEKHNNRKLNKKQVIEIYNSKKRNCDLADKYKVSRSTITNIKKRQLWDSVTSRLVP